MRYKKRPGVGRGGWGLGAVARDRLAPGEQLLAPAQGGGQHVGVYVTPDGEVPDLQPGTGGEEPRRLDEPVQHVVGGVPEHGGDIRPHLARLVGEQLALGLAEQDLHVDKGVESVDGERVHACLRWLGVVSAWGPSPTSIPFSHAPG